MGKLIVHNAVTINGVFDAPTPDEWRRSTGPVSCGFDTDR